MKFFVVRSACGKLTFSIEHGNFADRYAKEDRPLIKYRAELWGAAETMSLTELTERYRRGERIKPPPKPTRRKQIKSAAEVMRIKREHRAKSSSWGRVVNEDEFYDFIDEPAAGEVLT